MNPETTESARGIEFLAWLEVNKMRLAVGAGVVVVAVAAVSLQRWRAAERELAASSALVRAHQFASVGTNAVKPDAAAFLKISSEFGSTDAASRALLFAADALFGAGKYAESQTQFEQYLASYPDSRPAAIAAFGIAACLDAQGKTSEARQGYDAVVVRYPDSSVASQAKLAIAGFHEGANEPAQALRLYDELAKTGWASAAYARRELLLSRHPELATNTPPAAVPPVSGIPADLTNPVPAAAP
jgi:TolA-binding protein